MAKMIMKSQNKIKKPYFNPIKSLQFALMLSLMVNVALLTTLCVLFRK